MKHNKHIKIDIYRWQYIHCTASWVDLSYIYTQISVTVNGIVMRQLQTHTDSHTLSKQYNTIVHYKGVHPLPRLNSSSIDCPDKFNRTCKSREHTIAKYIHFLTYYFRLNSSRKRNTSVSFSSFDTRIHTHQRPSDRAKRLWDRPQNKLLLLIAGHLQVGRWDVSVINQKWCSVYNVPLLTRSR